MKSRNAGVSVTLQHPHCMPETSETDFEEGHPSARGQQTKDGVSRGKVSGETSENVNILHGFALPKLHNSKWAELKSYRGRELQLQCVPFHGNEDAQLDRYYESVHTDI